MRVIAISLFIATTSLAWAQTNTFPLLSSGEWSGGSGDLTNITSPHLKLNASTGYSRSVFTSAHASVSTVFNFQTGKNVYWGEPTDGGQYIFRGRDLIIEQGQLGLGTFSPSVWFGGAGKVLEIAGPRPVLKLGSTGSLSTLVFTTSAVNGTSHNGEFHFNHEYDSSDPTVSRFRFFGYPGGELLTLLANGKVGIGNLAPAASLHIGAGSGTLHYGTQGLLIKPNSGDRGIMEIHSPDGQNRLVLQALPYASYLASLDSKPLMLCCGKVGLGYTVPTTAFSFGQTIASRMLSLYDDPADWYGLGVQSYQLRFQVGTSNARFSFLAGDNSELLTIKGSGDVGIGTSTPDSKLSVKGQIHAQEVKVDLNGAAAPDYVFDKDYKLPSLEEIRSYIDANKHLPEVPSAKEMEANGINVGEMNLLLLKKVEELTLYIIDLQKQVKDLQTAVTKH